MASNTNYQVIGKNKKALFRLKAHRGEGMLLLAMNWKKGKPPMDFVGFSIEYKEPEGNRFFALNNRISFLNPNGTVNSEAVSSLKAPFQKFRWVHFPRNANLPGNFTYLVKPVFMNETDELRFGEPQTIEIELNRDTYPDKLNIAFTRGFVSSQAFVDKYEVGGGITKLLPSIAKAGLEYTPTHPKTKEALSWMGFEATNEIETLLNQAISDKNAKVYVIAYDLNLPKMLSQLLLLGNRVKIIIDDSAEHGKADAAETTAFKQLTEQGKAEVKRQHMGSLQHNKMIIVEGTEVKAAVCGSTNFSWRGFYVQSNNAVIIRGAKAIEPFITAFDNYWKFDDTKNFVKTSSALWNDLRIKGIDARVSFSPHAASNALLEQIADDVQNQTLSNLFYSLAFLYQTTGAIREAITTTTQNNQIFVYGVSDKKTGGLDVQKPDGSLAPVYPSELSKNLPEPFKSEPKGGSGTRMHHKFIVIDFDKPTARVYLGSYNFSSPADRKNGENLLLIKDRKIAVAYMIEALRIFDHYHFRISVKEAKKTGKPLCLAKPPRNPGETAWWQAYYTNPHKIKDRELFS